MKLINAIILLTFSFVSKGMGSQREYHCGRKLADLLDFICSGRGFYWTNDHSPIIQKRNAVQYLQGSTSSVHARRRRGIVNECCENPCSPAQMESYCAVPAGTYVANPTAAPLSPEDAARLMQGESRYHGQEESTTEPQIPTTTTTTTTTTPEPPSVIKILQNLKKLRKPFGRTQMMKLLRKQGGNNKFFWVRKVGSRPTRTPVILN